MESGGGSGRYDPVTKFEVSPVVWAATARCEGCPPCLSKGENAVRSLEAWSSRGSDVCERAQRKVGPVWKRAAAFPPRCVDAGSLRSFGSRFARSNDCRGWSRARSGPDSSRDSAVCSRTSSAADVVGGMDGEERGGGGCDKVAIPWCQGPVIAVDLLL